MLKEAIIFVVILCALIYGAFRLCSYVMETQVLYPYPSSPSGNSLSLASSSNNLVLPILKDDSW